MRRLPREALAVREAGIWIRLTGEFSEMAWQRVALWSEVPEGWADASFAAVPVAQFESTLSRRNVKWVQWMSRTAALLLTPLAESAGVRSAGPGEFVIADFLGAGDFLGKFDRDTIEKKWTTGESLKAGLELRLLTPQQGAKLIEAGRK